MKTALRNFVSHLRNRRSHQGNKPEHGKDLPDGADTGKARARRRSRGGAEIGTLVVVGAVIVGAVFGNGLADTVVQSFDGLTWLSDHPNGQVVEVNPETGKPQQRLQIGGAGDELDITQRDDMLIVTNRRTGEVIVINLATLLVSGRRQSDVNTEVLVNQGRVYLADLTRGVVRRVDPVTTTDIGDSWSAGKAITDAVISGDGVVWALDQGGQLRGLNWSDHTNRFAVSHQQPVSGAGQQSALVPHPKGITVIGPEGGVVVQVGTGTDVAVAAPKLRGPILAAPEAPDDLVPASVTDKGTVVMVSGDKVLEVDVTPLGCDRPGRPAVFRGAVYVPCRGARRVVVLSVTGKQARPAIATPQGGDPELVLDDGRLVINVPGGDSAIVVRPDGSTDEIKTREPGTPVHKPEDPRYPSPSGSGGDASPSGEPPTSTEATPTPAAPDNRAPRPEKSTRTRKPTTPVTPRNVGATVRADGSVLVKWSSSSEPQAFRVLASQNQGAYVAVATVRGSASAATVTTLNPGTQVTFVIEADYGSAGTRRSAASNTVTTYSRPGAVPTFFYNMLVANGGYNFSFSWDAAPGNGSEISFYTLTISGKGGGRATKRVAGSERSTTMFLPCAARCADSHGKITIVASNRAGAGPAVTWNYGFGPPPSPNTRATGTNKQPVVATTTDQPAAGGGAGTPPATTVLPLLGIAGALSGGLVMLRRRRRSALLDRSTGGTP